jgi:hypothetical protein
MIKSTVRTEVNLHQLLKAAYDENRRLSAKLYATTLDYEQARLDVEAALEIINKLKSENEAWEPRFPSVLYLIESDFS